MPHRKTLLIAWLVCAAALPAAYAKEPIRHPASRPASGTCPASLGVAEQIACLQGANAVLKAQNALLQEQVQRKELVKKMEGDGAQSRALGLPDVMAIFGAGERIHATLAWTDAKGQGGALTVSPGDVIPGGWRVEHIGNGRVMIRKGAASHVLLLASGEAVTTAQTTASLLPPAPQNTVFGATGGAGGVTTVPPMPPSLPFAPAR